MAAAAAMGLLLMQKRLCRKRKKAGSSRSLPEEEEEVEKTVYLGANAWLNEQRVTDWYVIKLSSKDCSSNQTNQNQKKKRKKKKKTGRVVLGFIERRRPILQPCTTSAAAANAGLENQQQQQLLYIKPIPRNTQLSRRDGNCFVALGSTIYCISATNARSYGVLAWDTTTRHAQQWQRVASMHAERCSRSSEAVATDDGKIYVFGGFSDGDNIQIHLLCEVFDPTENWWQSINPPASYMHPHDFVFSVYDHTSMRIFLGTRIYNLFLVYHLSNESWEILPQKFLHSMEIHISSPAFFDNTIYWIQIVEKNISKCGLCAYDLDLGVIIRGHIIGVHPDFWGFGMYMWTMKLIHFRGDEFYLIWLQHRTNLVRCERMRVSKQQGSLDCYVLSTKTYVLDNQPWPLDIGATVVL